MMMSTEPPAAIHGIPLPTADTSGDELFRMGLLYSTGQGGAPLDYVSAHMLFNLAAMRGSMEAKVYRKELSAGDGHRGRRRSPAPGARVAGPGLSLTGSVALHSPRGRASVSAEAVDSE